MSRKNAKPCQLIKHAKIFCSIVSLVPYFDKTKDAIVEYLKNDFNNVKRRTKLTFVDIQQLIELCVSKCYFLYNNLIWKLYNSDPIGLSIMFVLSECYLKRLEEKSIALSFALNPIQEGLFRGCSRMGSKNLSHISYNDETWHSYTLPKEDPKTI